MRRITFANPQNNLSIEFSTSTPMMFLESFNGNSCGAEAITQKPLEFDGQRLISTSLNARTIEMAVQFGGKSVDGKTFSRTEALKKWDEIQKVLTPGIVGTLTWSDGTNSRYIKCRLAEFPNFTQILPFLFRAEFSFVADLPLWYDSTETVMTVSRGATIPNDTGLYMPFRVEASASGGSAFALASTNTGKGLGFTTSSATSFVIDMAECTVKDTDGNLLNYLLGASSEFFMIPPGGDRITCAGQNATVTVKYNKVYMGVY